MAPITVLQPKTKKKRNAVAPKADRTLEGAAPVARGASFVAQCDGGECATRGLASHSERRPVSGPDTPQRHGVARVPSTLPASQPKRPNGLILMLHGCHQPRTTLPWAPI